MYAKVTAGLLAGFFLFAAGGRTIAAPAQEGGKLQLGASALLPTPERPLGWRGDWTGHYPGATPPLTWNIGTNGADTNVCWRTQLPMYAGGSGASQPIAFGGRAYFCVGPKDSTRGVQDLFCVNLTDGRILWVKPLTFYDGAPEEDRKQVEAVVAPLLPELDKLTREMIETLNAGKLNQDNWRDNVCGKRIALGSKINDALIALNPKKYQVPGRHDWGFASATPCSDGKAVYVWFANRLAARITLAGELAWAKFAPDVAKGSGEHGYHGSPALLPDRMVAVYGSTILAFDKQTGAVLWQQEPEPAWGLSYSSLVPAQIGNDAVLLLAHGQALRADNGKSLWGKFGGYQGENTTPVCENGTLYTFERSGIRSFTLPGALTNGVKLAAAGSLMYTNIFAEYQIASPLFCDGLLYCVSDRGLLHVFDPTAGTTVYNQLLPLREVKNSWVGAPGLSASPAIGGKNLYVTDTAGTTVVLQPGRVYNLMARNECATRDHFVTSPVFIGKLMLLRGQSALYGIGQP